MLIVWDYTVRIPCAVFDGTTRDAPHTSADVSQGNPNMIQAALAENWQLLGLLVPDTVDIESALLSLNSASSAHGI